MSEEAQFPPLFDRLIVPRVAELVRDRVHGEIEAYSSKPFVFITYPARSEGLSTVERVHRATVDTGMFGECMARLPDATRADIRARLDRVPRTKTLIDTCEQRPGTTVFFIVSGHKLADIDAYEHDELTHVYQQFVATMAVIQAVGEMATDASTQIPEPSSVDPASDLDHAPPAA